MFVGHNQTIAQPQEKENGNQCYDVDGIQNRLWSEVYIFQVHDIVFYHRFGQCENALCIGSF